jgi:Flp pilus assembly protein TadG
MQKPLFEKLRGVDRKRHRERGVTIALVALAMVAIIGMAALSIDVVTLYLAKEEAQRSADAAALTAARILSVSGITGDPSNSTGNWLQICGPDDGTNGIATRAAKSVVAQNTVGGLAPATINVTYSAGTNGAVGAGTTDCTTLSTSAFGVNPLVTVQITRSSLPTFFSRFWGNKSSSVSATATAEAFNPSDSGTVGNQTSGTIIPVQPRCVKPWAVPNLDPLNPNNTANCTTNCLPFVKTADGSIQNPGISVNGTGTSGVIGETFWLVPDCKENPNNCTLRTTPPQANFNGTGNTQPPPNLTFLPGQVGTTVNAIPSCSNGNPYDVAITGCDQGTNYSCGVPNNGNIVDLTINPDRDTGDAVSCLIHQANMADLTFASGQDSLNPFGAPSSYPFQILAGSSNPLVGAGVAAGSPISSSTSIVAMPIYDVGPPAPPIQTNTMTNVTFVGFLQVFINAVDSNGNINVTVLNVAGCGNGSGNPVGTPVVGTSPVPVRLITPP